MTIDRKTVICAFILGAVFGTLLGPSLLDVGSRPTGDERLAQIKREIDILVVEAFRIYIADLEANREDEQAECHDRTIRFAADTIIASDGSWESICEIERPLTVCEALAKLNSRSGCQCENGLYLVGTPTTGIWKIEGPMGDRTWIPENMRSIASAYADQQAEIFAPSTQGEVRFRWNDLPAMKDICP